MAEPAKEAVEQCEQIAEEGLLHKHYPRYLYDGKEKYFPVDLNRYTADKSTIDGCNGVAAQSKDGEHTWLIYMNYFLYDGGVGVLKGAGSHRHDLEMVIVEINNSTQNVSGVFYGPHSSYEHMWIRHKDDLQQILDIAGRPVAYVSLGKHGNYPISGSVTRLFGFGTDSCTNPQARDRPLFILDEHARRVKSIDGEFSGPMTKITRDWSVAPEVRIKDVRKRMMVPPAEQIRSQLSKLVSSKKK